MERLTVTPNASFSRRCSRSTCTCVALLLTAGLVHAQEIQWRHDYNSARRESQQGGRPLLLDFGTDHCYWCVKLDSTTFRDPTVVSVVNKSFVPLKVHAGQQRALASYLNIQSFPTVILADSDGKILATLEGYMDASHFNDHLQRVGTTLSNPDWMVHDFQAASKAHGDSDYARALAILARIVEDGKTRPIQVKARQLLKDIEIRAEPRLVQARQCKDAGKITEATEIVVEVVKRFPGTHAAAAAGEMVKQLAAVPDAKTKQRTDRARELLAEAREDFKLQRYLACLDHCDNLINYYFDLPEATEALQLANQIKNNPEWMHLACDAVGERLGQLYLALAESYLKKGNTQRATVCLEHVIQVLPGSRLAEAAQARLEQTQGKSTQPANYKQP